MQDRNIVSNQQITEDLLRFPMATPLWFWLLVIALGIGVGLGIVTFGLMVYNGLGILAINRPIFWGVMIATFVFWVGISHAGVMISAILRLSQAEWRRPVTRAAEVLTVFALSTAALFPLVHTGRPWRSLYWVFPYDFSRGIFPNVRSALIWDPSAIFTYLTGSALFVYVALIPDLAVARDRSTGWRHRFYSITSMGFRGSPRQWRLQALAGILLSALILPVFVSVHSIVSWDFGMTLVPAWHSTVFAPYFVIGAILSGVSAVVTLMAILRKLFHLDRYITPDHFDSLGRLLIVVALGWFFFYMMDFVFGLYSLAPDEVAVNQLRYFTWPFSWASVIFILYSFVIPVSLWTSRRVRRNITAMFWISLLVNIGMWLERYILIIPGIAWKQPFTFSWGYYAPTAYEWYLIVASICLVSLGLLLFSKIFPVIPLFDIKEGQILAQEVKVGRVHVPAVIRE